MMPSLRTSPVSPRIAPRTAAYSVSVICWSAAMTRNMTSATASTLRTASFSCSVSRPWRASVACAEEMTSLGRRPLANRASRRRSMVRVRICIGPMLLRGPEAAQTFEEPRLLRRCWDEALPGCHGLTVAGEQAVAKVAHGSRREGEENQEESPGAAHVTDHRAHGIGVVVDANLHSVGFEPDQRVDAMSQPRASEQRAPRRTLQCRETQCLGAQCLRAFVSEHPLHGGRANTAFPVEEEYWAPPELLPGLGAGCMDLGAGHQPSVAGPARVHPRPSGRTRQGVGAGGRERSRERSAAVSWEPSRTRLR